MSDRDFEKQVRQKLDDLKMTPSPASWMKIEEGLRDGMPRRLPFLLISLLVVGLGLAGYWGLNKMRESGNRQSTVAETSVDKSIIKGEDKSPNRSSTAAASVDKSSMKGKDKSPERASTVVESSVDKSPAVKSEIPKHQSSVSEPSVNKSPIADSKDETFNHRSTVAHRSVHKTQIANRKEKHLNRPSSIADSRVNKSPITNTNDENLNGRSTIAKAPIDKSSTIDNEKYLHHYSKLLYNSYPTFQKPLSFNNLTLSSLTTTPVRNPLINKTKKWSLGVNVTAGISAVNQGNFLNFSSAKVEDVAFRPTFASQGYMVSYTPSAMKPAFSFSIGATAKRELSERLSISAGISYLQLNARNKVGEKIYGSQVVNNGRNYLYVSNYYLLQQDKASDYNNRYHFIELPVSLNVKLNNSRKYPLYWNGGLAIAQLVSSNSLHFDGTTGVYYKNNNLLNKTQAAFTTGFSVSLLSNKQYPVWIGPTARYYLTRMLQKDVSADKNFMSVGMNVKIFLK